MAFVPNKVHLVGSVALNSVQEVLSTAGKLLGRRLDRIPDGEPGGRRHWIAWQLPVLRASPYLAPAAGESARDSRLCLAAGVKPEDVQFGELGYAREARPGYQDFLDAKKAGDIPTDTKFQVALPTPLAVISSYCVGEDLLAIERPYEKAMLKEVAAIAAAIPHDELCIQWDICLEMIMWDGQSTQYTPRQFEDVRLEVVSRIKRLAAEVPADVELGLHLCYGDRDAKHFVEPRDAAKMTELANALSNAITRKIAYIHMPAPINRMDEDYFKPFAELRLHPETQIFLGLVHADGPEATRARIAVANNYVPRFGIATECGIARKRTPELVRSLLELHAHVSEEPY